MSAQLEAVLAAAKHGEWHKFKKRLNAKGLTFEDFNQIPPGRSWGVVHQLAYWGQVEPLRRALEKFPRIDLNLKTKQGTTVEDIIAEEKHSEAFTNLLNEKLASQTHQEIVSAARDGDWYTFKALLNSPRMTLEALNSVPPGRTWGVIHQISYWGATEILKLVLDKFEKLNLELETSEDAAQTPEDIARGRGVKAYLEHLRERIDSATKSAPAKIPSSKMKTPISGVGKTCSICFMDDHEEGTIGVACDNDHFMCEGCFGMYVQTECDVKENPQSVILKGGRVLCPRKKSDDCDSNAFANKLIAMVVSDERYELYLRARDFVVGKEAIAGALSKIESGGLAQVEQEQIRNLYIKADGTFSAYMCKKCKFGPIDHGWCNSLSTHHEEKKGETGQINNACPKCGWFAPVISKWLKWDGKFREGGKAIITQADVFTMGVQELKSELAKRGLKRSGNKAELQYRLSSALGATAKKHKY